MFENPLTENTMVVHYSIIKVERETDKSIFDGEYSDTRSISDFRFSFFLSATFHCIVMRSNENCYLFLEAEGQCVRGCYCWKRVIIIIVLTTYKRSIHSVPHASFKSSTKAIFNVRKKNRENNINGRSGKHRRESEWMR